MTWPWQNSVIKTPPLIENALVIRALAAEIDGLPIVESVLTVIDAHREELIEGIPALVSDHGKVAKAVGGIQALDWLRENLLTLREQGRKDE